MGQKRVQWWNGEGQDSALYLREREIMPPITAAAFGFESFNTYGGLLPTQVDEIRAVLDETPNPSRIGHPRVLDMLNVRYVASSVPLEDEALRLLDMGDVYVYENTRVLPRATLVHDWTRVADEAEALVAVRQPGFDPARRAVISAEAHVPDSSATSGLAQPSSQVVMLENRPGALRYSVQTDTPALLVVSNWHYPGWKAEVNGHATALVQANYLLQALYLEPGESTVELVYEPASLRLGAGITLAGLLALGLVAGSVVLWQTAQARPVKAPPGYRRQRGPGTSEA